VTPAQLVPGIEKYPDLAESLAARLPSKQSGCGGCGTGKLAADYRQRLQARLERDKFLKRP
jgi:hypothetical protein